jgi:DNA polymerase-1
LHQQSDKTHLTEFILMAKKRNSAQPNLFEMDSPVDFVQEPTPTEPAKATKPRSTIPGPDDLVILIDSHSLIYQVFHALPSMTNPKGQEVGAVHGFLRDIASLIQQWTPDFLVCTFDESEITFRNELYDQYKAHREPMPDALREQIGLIHHSLDVLRIPKISLGGYEADDLMATLATDASARGARVLLVTSDKDCRQLLSDRIQILNLRKNELFGPEELKAVWGIRPDQVVDFQSMVGDSVDNVPGIPMIGPKAAQQLLDQFDSLDNILANVDSVPGAKKQENLRVHRDKALLSRTLVELKRDCPISLTWSEMQLQAFDRDAAKNLFQDLGFRRLAEQFLNVDKPDAPKKPVDNQLSRDGYRTVTCTEELKRLIADIGDARVIAIDTETTSTRARDASIVGLSLAWQPGSAAYIPILSPSGAPQLDWEQVRQEISALATDSNRIFIGQNIKYDLIVLRNYGIELENIGFDTMVADYLLDAGGRNHDLDDIAKRWLGHNNTPITSLIGSGKNQGSMADVPLDAIGPYACEDVDVPFRLFPVMQKRLAEESLDNVMTDLELPLINVLTDMEFEGIRISIDRLKELGKSFQARTIALFDEIIELAGESFNPDSPKQLSTILFEKLGLRVVKRTKTGPSTDAEVLEELAPEHPLPAKIIEYRQFTKLKNTYVDALPKLVSPKTNRLHTSFRQDIAATGRLSSVEPNLQNIPVRTPEGRSIRSAFLSRAENWSLVAADYSQIELRVLAHCSQDEIMSQAFRDDQDIHTIVAAQIHGVGLSEVTSEMRRRAKAVNFGIIYGQSPFGLSKALGISRTDASDFIDAYFAQYPAVRDFISKTLIDCRRNGYVKTMSGRKRSLLGIRDYPSLPEAKQKQLLEPERMAINTVIQGSAADMIKLAMIEIRKRLRATNWPAKMILQIHDELIFDCPDELCEPLADLVRDAMIHVMPLSVPLKVDVKRGKNWAECEAM